MIGLEGVEMSPCSLAVVTQVSHLMDVEGMVTRLQT